MTITDEHSGACEPKDALPLPEDVFCVNLNQCGARFVLIGPSAARHHRLTDGSFGQEILIETTAENVERVRHAATSSDHLFSSQDLARLRSPGKRLVLRDLNTYIRTSIPGLKFPVVFDRAILKGAAGAQCRVISLIHFKEYMNALKDDGDIEDCHCWFPPTQVDA